MKPTGYQVYKEQSVYTMTRGELLLTVYDELLKRLAKAELALDQGDTGVFVQSVKRSREIVDYLIETLNFQYGISHDLKRMYDFFNYELARLDAGRKVETINELKPLVKELRDAFAEAEKMTNI